MSRSCLASTNSLVFIGYISSDNVLRSSPATYLPAVQASDKDVLEPHGGRGAAP